MCDIHKIKCPSVCTCLVFAMKCSKTEIQLTIWSHKFKYMMILISYSKIYTLDQLFIEVKGVSFLFLSSNNISEVCHVSTLLLHLKVFDASDNKISQIKQERCISNLPDVTVVRLEKNKITLIEKQSFNNLSHLHLLNLSDNLLTAFNFNWISRRSIQVLTLLSVKGNPIKQIHRSIFDTLNVTLLQTTDYRFCCLFSADVDCDSLKPWYISCSNLLPSKAMQIVFICISLILIIVNLVSVVYQIISIRKNKKAKAGGPGMKKPNSCYEGAILSVNASDMVLAIYFCIIWISSLVYHETYFSQGRRVEVSYFVLCGI